MWMKTYEETICTVFARMDAYEKERERKRGACRKAASWACCLCLTILLGAGIWQSGILSGPEMPGPGDGDVTDSVSVDKIVVCPMDAAGAGLKQDMDIGLFWEDFVEMTPAELADHYGVDVMPEVPADLKAWEDQQYGVFRREGGAGELYWDGNVLNYSNESFDRSVNLEVWKHRDFISCVAFFDLIEDRSVINGVEVALALSEGGYYHAEFTRDGVGFRLIAEGLSEEEVVDVIRSLTR